MFCMYLLVEVHLEAGGRWVCVCVLCVLVSVGAPGGRWVCVYLLMGVHLEVGIRWVYLDFMFCSKQKSFAVTSLQLG